MDESLGHILLSRSGNDGASRGQAAMVVTAVLTSISILVVAMRMYTRIGLLKLSGREDWTILASMVFAIIYLGLVIAEYHFGLGRHSDSIPYTELKEQLKSLWAAIPMYNASLALTKASLLFQYLRIFPGRRFRTVCHIVLGVVVLYTTWAIVSGFVNCVPVTKFWDRELPGICLSFEALWFFNASMNIATDLALLVLPMPLISQLHLPWRQKIALLAVFALGGLVVVTSILRLSSLRTVAKSTDTSWSNVAAAYWTAAECNVAIICACLPFLRPLISRIFPKFLSTNSYNKTRSRTTANPARSTAARSRCRSTHFTAPDPTLFSRDAEIGLATIDTDVGVGAGAGTGARITKIGNAKVNGIEVTNEVIQEVSHEGYPIGPQTSQTRLVLDDR
ncbi:PTH11-like integral membrane protein [Aspergillus undulatus]|uniref:PTH11-like integral membrane protein n=1 Tax=Aspergillus undulatus TaxID=1810928 RepID=UPI003CCDD3BF